jgi:hypothetical protein
VNQMKIVGGVLSTIGLNLSFGYDHYASWR